VIELRFHPEYYNGFSIDEAVKTYSNFATTDMSRDEENFVLKVTATQTAIDQGIDERTIALEMANYALGLTIERVRGGAVR
jgi:hypothetical protein